MNRRSFAVPIRLRQELAKRLDAFGGEHKWQGLGSLTDEVTVPRHSPFEALLTGCRVTSSRVFPAIESAGKGPTDAEAIVSQAWELYEGDWMLFDTPMQVAPGPPAWRQHPLSRVETPLTHFSQMAYTGDHLGGDVKYIWELNRHAELLRMAQGYWLTGDEKLADKVVVFLTDWMEHNPPNLGVNWVSALEVAFRSIAWCWIWKLTSRSSAWTPEVFARFIWTLARSAHFVDQYDSIHHSPNTHLTGEGLGLLYIADSFPQLKLAQVWRKRGIDILRSEVPHQFLDDGFHYERATGYHRYNVEFYLHALAIARFRGETWAEPFTTPLTKALNATAALRMPDGDWPVFGDEDGGVAVRLWASGSRNQNQLLALGAALLDQPRWMEGLQEGDTSLAWWMGTKCPPSSHRTESRFVALPEAGYFGGLFDSVNGQVYCVVDAGPHGGNRTGHAHTDLGHVEIAFGHSTIIADPGCAVYASDNERRNWYRSLAAHATLTVDDNPLAHTRGVFGWSHIAPTPEVQVSEAAGLWSCRLWYDVPGVGVSHERQVLVCDGQVVIADFIRGTGSPRLTWHWPLGQHIPAGEVMSPISDLEIGDAVMGWCSSEPCRVMVRDSVRSPTYGSEQAVSIVEMAMPSARTPTIMVTYFRRIHVTSPHVSVEDDSVGIRFHSGSVVVARRGLSPELSTSGADPVASVAEGHA